MVNKENTKTNEEVVSITRAELDGIYAQLDSLKGDKSMKKPKRVTERTALLRFLKDKPVVWYGNVVEKKDNTTGKLVAYMDVKLEGEDKVTTVGYLDFLNSPNSVPVSIKSQKVEEIVESQGTVVSKNPDEAKISTKTFQSREIDVEVVTRKYVAEVEVLEGDHKGETFTVSTEALNR